MFNVCSIYEQEQIKKKDGYKGQEVSKIKRVEPYRIMMLGFLPEYVL